jgi:hypothetical protein
LNPRILHGRSFKGAAAYLLKGSKHELNEKRVAWTMTRNLATQNPETAWRVMAAIAMDAPQRKKEAGIPSTGRKQKNIVKHLVLTWHPEEKETLTREDMEAAIEGALKALGAENQQALIISHNDTKHPHVHILINRTLDNGALLDDSNEWNNLSAWALEYQRQRGQHYSPQRELNAEARARGEKTKYRPVPRHIIDAEKFIRQSANDNPDRRIELRHKHHALAKEQANRSHRLKKRHKAQWDDLQHDFLQNRHAIREQARKGQAAARVQIIETFRPQWRALKEAEIAERRQFEAREKSTFGRLSNLFRNVDIAHAAADGPRPSILSQLWRGIGDATERQAMFDKQLSQRRQELDTRQRKAIRAAMLPVVAAYKMESETAVIEYRRARADLTFIQRGELAKNKAEWHQLIERRKADFEKLALSLERTQEFNKAADPQSFLDKLRNRAADFRQDRDPPGPSNDNDRTRDD